MARTWISVLLFWFIVFAYVAWMTLIIMYPDRFEKLDYLKTNQLKYFRRKSQERYFMDCWFWVGVSLGLLVPLALTQSSYFRTCLEMRQFTSTYSEKVEEALRKGRHFLNSTGMALLNEYVASCGNLGDENMCRVIELKVEELLNDSNNKAPDIRFMKFEKLDELISFPRFPDRFPKDNPVEEVICNLKDIDRDNSLLIFISHCWLRGRKDDEGFDDDEGYHPDNCNNDKLRLCIEGINQIKKIFAPTIANCYVWFDYSCMDQINKKNLKDELERYDKVMECCDLMFTPVVDPEHESWEFPDSTINLNSYKAKHWIGSAKSYLNRGWCRVEMLYAAHIPILPNSNPDKKRHEMFQGALAQLCYQNRRPHFIYGDKEYEELDDPRLLPSLRKNHFSKYHPERGSLSVREDRTQVKMLVNDLKYFIKKNNASGYSGNTRNGYGVKVSKNGDTYRGQWDNFEYHGEGEMMYDDGTYYKGNWVKGKKEGLGEFRFDNGDVYMGEFSANRRAGQGKLTKANGNVFEGNFEKGRALGEGVISYTDGSCLNGIVRRDDRHKLVVEGKYFKTNGEVFDVEYGEYYQLMSNPPDHQSRYNKTIYKKNIYNL